MRCNLKASLLSLAACSLAFTVVTAYAQTNNKPVTGLTSNPTYEKSCGKCHGKNATGHRFGGPSLVSVKVAASSDDDVRNIIVNGKGHMPKFAGKLTDEEINALVRQIQSLNGK